MSMYRVGKDVKDITTPLPVEEIIGWFLAVTILVGLFLLFAHMSGKAPVVDGQI